MTTEKIQFKDLNKPINKFTSFVSSLDNEDRYDWIRAAGKANQLWKGGQEGLFIFDEWSSSASNYMGYEDCKYHYNSLKNNRPLNKYKGIFEKNKDPRNDENYTGFASVSHIYDISTPATSAHPYLKSHHVKPYGCRQYGTHLHIPMYNMKGKLIALQSIENDGRKSFAKGSKIKNLFLKIGKLDSKLIFCEGYATGAAIHEVTGLPVIVTFNANNLRSVPKLFRKKLPRTKFYIAADDDFRSGGSANVGVDSANESAKNSRARVIIPLSKDGKRRKQDFCDVLIRDGIYFLTKILREQIS